MADTTPGQSGEAAAARLGPYQPNDFTKLGALLPIYETFRSYILHEDNLINYRMTWMLTIHGFLYATYGFTLQKKLEILEKLRATPKYLYPEAVFRQTPELDQALGYALFHVDAFLALIAFVGLVLCWSGWRSISAAERASSNLRLLFEAQFPLVSVKRKDGSISTVSTYYSGYNWFRRRSERDVYIQKVAALSGLFVPTIGGGGNDSTVALGASASQIIPKLLAAGWGITLVLTGGYYSDYVRNAFKGFILPGVFG